MQAIRKYILIKLIVANACLVLGGYFIGWFCYSDLRDEINQLYVQVYDAELSLGELKDRPK
jgi:hypothetical protein